MLYWEEERDLKIALLQLRKRRFHFLASVEGDLVQKRKLITKRVSKAIKEQFSTERDKYGWKFAPRARIAVAMKFFAGSNQTPALHNLVKYYLDELRSVLFNDDRQVFYLSGECWPKVKQNRELGEERESKVYIDVERLSDYKERLKLYFKMIRNSELKDHLRWNHRELIDRDDDFDYPFPINPALFPPEHREAMRQFAIKEEQSYWLSKSKLQEEDGPVLPEWAKHLPKEFLSLREREHFTVDLGSLPTRDGTQEYKERIRTGLQRFKIKWPVFDPILIPVELDVQVTLRSTKLPKDLDNIMRDIIPIFSEELLGTGAYLHAYRIYVCEPLSDSVKPDHLRLKLLPMGAVSEYKDVVDKTLDVAEDWISDKI
jgi:hypothetical protein